MPALVIRLPDGTELGDHATVTVEETAKVLGVSRGNAYEAVRTGQIPSLRLGSRIVVPVPKLLAMLGVEGEAS